MSGDFDLFGQPVLVSRRRGGSRAQHPNAEYSSKIKALVYRGYTKERIARALGLAPCTLYDRYFSEIGARLGIPGRRSHEPTGDSRRLVEHLARVGRTIPEIAKAVGVSAPTLRKHYRQELSAAGHRG